MTRAVPQTRQGGFYPSALKKGSRTEQALRLALAEMYVQGVSTRKVIEVLQRLVGPEVSISSTKSLPPRRRGSAVPRSGSTRGWRRWRARPLGVTPYVLLEARLRACARSRSARRLRGAGGRRDHRDRSSPRA